MRGKKGHNLRKEMVCDNVFIVKSFINIFLFLLFFCSTKNLLDTKLRRKNGNKLLNSKIDDYDDDNGDVFKFKIKIMGGHEWDNMLCGFQLETEFIVDNNY